LWRFDKVLTKQIWSFFCTPCTLDRVKCFCVFIQRWTAGNKHIHRSAGAV